MKLDGNPLSNDPTIQADPLAAIVTDLNDWSRGEEQAVAPHCKGGAVKFMNDASTGTSNGRTSAEIGAVGGNVGYLDGSVTWKNIKNMRVYRGSQNVDYGESGCTAMW